MAGLDFRVEVNFPGEFHTEHHWTDITGRVRSMRVRRGRSHELDRVEAGTAKLTLDDPDRRFDPTDPDSPYQPDLVPARPVRISWAHGQGARLWLFHGIIRGWPPQWITSDHATVQLDCSDEFRKLNAQGSQVYRFATSEEAEEGEAEPFMQGSGFRVGRLLDLAGWDATRRELDDGQARVWVDPDPEGRPDVMRGIDEAATAEGGPFLIAPNGDAAFHNRHRRLLPGDNVQAVFAGPGAQDGIPTTDVVPETGDDQLRNRITTQSPAHDDYRVQDDASASRFYRATFEQHAPWWHHAEQADRAHWLRDRFAEPGTRVAQLTWRPDKNPDHRLKAGLDVGDRVTVAVAPRVGEEWRQDCHVEHVEHRVRSVAEWEVTLRLSPADERYYATLDDDVYGLLGDTTVLAH